MYISDVCLVIPLGQKQTIRSCVCPVQCRERLFDLNRVKMEKKKGDKKKKRSAVTLFCLVVLNSAQIAQRFFSLSQIAPSLHHSWLPSNTVLHRTFICVPVTSCLKL